MTVEDALLGQLGSVFEAVDPVPAPLVDSALATFSWRDPDTALAELVSDSLTAATDIRGDHRFAPRLLTFEATGLAVEVEVAATGDTRRLLGQLVPPQSATIDVRWADGLAQVTADDLGRFTVDSVPTGLLSLVCHLRAWTQPVATSWLSV